MKYPADHLVIHEEINLISGNTTYYTNTYYNGIKQQHSYFTRQAAETWVEEYLRTEKEAA